MTENIRRLKGDQEDVIIEREERDTGEILYWIKQGVDLIVLDVGMAVRLIKEDFRP